MYGDYLSTTNLHIDFKRLLQRAELPNIRFHDLRHSAASFLVKLGVHPKVVQEILGHSNISMTMDIYSHIFPSMQQEAMNKLDDLFKEKE
jgi:integrase